jgi:S-formylglutathione hydrolase FrmB
MKRSNFESVRKFLLLLSLLAFPSIGFSQALTVPDGTGRYVVRQIDSKLMGRKMNYGVILPSHYEDSASSGRRYSSLYLLHGLTGHFDNWLEKSSIADYVKDKDVIVVTPEGEDGWYTDSQAKDQDKYESYIVKELIPEVDSKYRTGTSRDSRWIAGLSMGGYGAIKFGLKYPDMFSVVGSFSGAIGAATITEQSFPGSIGKSIDAIFGPPDGVIRRNNDLFDIIRRAMPEKIKAYPFIYLDCGTEDFLFQNNRDFVALLVEKKVAHEFRQLPGGHTWKYWDQQVKEFIQSIPRFSSFKYE